MPRVIETTVYKYDELNDKAKAKARDWFREVCSGDNDFADHLTDKGGEFERFAKLMGWTLNDCKRRKGALAIYWSGFWSQGDGLHFVGDWKATDVNAAELKAQAPKDMELHRIADTYARLVGEIPAATGTIEGRSAMYVHEFTVTPELENDGNDTSRDTVETFRDITRALMKWMYRSLEESYNACNEDDNVAEVIRINEYEFLEDGKRA